MTPTVMADRAGHLHRPATEANATIIAIFELPGMTQAIYQRTTDKLTGGRCLVKSPADWPGPGLISHTAAPTPDGWFVADVGESEEAFQRFGDIIMPILREVGAPDVQPKIYPVFNLVTPQTGEVPAQRPVRQ